MDKIPYSSVKVHSNFPIYGIVDMINSGIHSSLPGANDKHALGGLDYGHFALSDGLRPPEVVIYDGL